MCQTGHENLVQVRLYNELKQINSPSVTSSSHQNKRTAHIKELVPQQHNQKQPNTISEKMSLYTKDTFI